MGWPAFKFYKIRSKNLFPLDLYINFDAKVPSLVKLLGQKSKQM